MLAIEKTVPVGGLTTSARYAFILLFILSPGLNVLLASVLCRVWRSHGQTEQARQIHQLGWIILALQAIVGLGLTAFILDETCFQ